MKSDKKFYENWRYIVFLTIIIFSCQSQDDAKKFTCDSTAIIEASVADSMLNNYFLDSYRKRAIPISVKSMSGLRPPIGFYYDEHSGGNQTMKDTLFVFCEIKNYTPSSSKVILRIPNEGVWAHYFLIKIKDKWTIVKDSTHMYET